MIYYTTSHVEASPAELLKCRVYLKRSNLQGSRSNQEVDTWARLWAWWLLMPLATCSSLGIISINGSLCHAEFEGALWQIVWSWRPKRAKWLTYRHNWFSCADNGSSWAEVTALFLGWVVWPMSGQSLKVETNHSLQLLEVQSGLSTASTAPDDLG